jgi:ribosomal protein S27AE
MSDADTLGMDPDEVAYLERVEAEQGWHDHRMGDVEGRLLRGSKRTCIKCGHLSVVAHGGAYKCSQCGADEPPDDRNPGDTDGAW